MPFFLRRLSQPLSHFDQNLIVLMTQRNLSFCSPDFLHYTVHYVFFFFAVSHYIIKVTMADAKIHVHTEYHTVCLERPTVTFLHPIILFLEFLTITCVIIYFNTFLRGSKALEMPNSPPFWTTLLHNAITESRHFVFHVEHISPIQSKCLYAFN